MAAELRAIYARELAEPARYDPGLRERRALLLALRRCDGADTHELSREADRLLRVGLPRQTAGDDLEAIFGLR